MQLTVKLDLRRNSWNYGSKLLVRCNVVNNDYQQDSRVLHTFVPNKPFGCLLEISPKNYIFLKRFNSEFQDIRVWFTDQNRRQNKFNTSN